MPGKIACRPNPASPCANKPDGLYCDPAKKVPSWPDPYVACPSLEQLYCISTAPVCRQDGTDVKCTAAPPL
jgi:hypothetical protein